MPTSEARLTRRRILAAATSLLTGAVLVSCSGDSSREAERGREADTQRESVVKDLQATQTWNIIHGTPPATPPPQGD